MTTVIISIRGLHDYALATALTQLVFLGTESASITVSLLLSHPHPPSPLSFIRTWKCGTTCYMQLAASRSL